MHHVGTITKSTKFPNREFHGECSCGTAGDFTTKEEASGYLNSHGAKVTALGPANTFKLVDDSAKPEVFPGLPTTHAPSATAAKSPVPPPPPPAPTPAKAAPAPQATVPPKR
jgi:hypothetical protein